MKSTRERRRIGATSSNRTVAGESRTACDLTRGLGLSDDEMEDLRTQRVIGETALNAQRLPWLHLRPVTAFPFGQLVRRDRTEGGRVAHEPRLRVGQRVGALESETTRCERTEE